MDKKSIAEQVIIESRYDRYLVWYHKWVSKPCEQSFLEFLMNNGFSFTTFIGNNWAKWRKEQIKGMDAKQVKQWESKEPDFIKHLHTLCYIYSDIPMNEGEQPTLGNVVFCVHDQTVEVFPFGFFSRPFLFNKHP